MKQPGDQQADRDIFNIDNKGSVTVINHPVQTRSRSESLLLQAVKQEVISRLTQSLHNAVFIHLGKQQQPQQVRRPLDAEVKIGAKAPEALPTETTILEVFDRPDIAGRLLILGEPGAGKTTTMLDLAEKLCDRAEQDAMAFIPVLLNLSSWKDPKQTMTDWLVEELKSKYGVRKDAGKQWLTDKQLLPLLDGLDEVKPEHQESCVAAMNRWLESDDRPPSLTVCCRREEYEKVVRGRWQAAPAEQHDETRMHLNGAILLQTLTDEQVQAYLTAANQPELWQMLQQDEALWELIRTPLWVSITLLSYEGLSPTQWQQATSTEERLALLWDAYIERMLHQQLKSKAFAKPKPPFSKQPLKRLVYQARFAKLNPPEPKQTRQWLAYLAKQLQRESQTEFLIESLQPSWLSQSKYRFFITIYIILYSFLILLSLSMYSVFASFKEAFERAAIDSKTPWSEIFWNEINTSSTSIVGVIVIFLIFLGMYLKSLEGKVIKIDFFERLNWSWNKAWQKLIVCLKNLMIFSVFSGGVAIIVFLFNLILFFLLISDPNALDSRGNFFYSTLSYLNPDVSMRDFSPAYCSNYMIGIIGKRAIDEYRARHTSYCSLIQGIDNIQNFISTIINLIIPIALIALVILLLILYWRREGKSFSFLVNATGVAISFASAAIVWFILALVLVFLNTLIEKILLSSYFTYFFLTNADLNRLFNDALNSTLSIILGILVISFLIAFVWGVVAGFRSQELVKKTKANQAVWNTLYNSLRLPIIFAIIFAFSFVAIEFLLWITSKLLFIYLNEGIYNPFNIIGRTIHSITGKVFFNFISAGKPGLITGLTVGLIVSYSLGIKSCLQHLALRRTLYRAGSIPWNYARFLDYCTERLLLQRVGGRYRFMHKSLQEHFARMGE